MSEDIALKLFKAAIRCILTARYNKIAQPKQFDICSLEVKDVGDNTIEAQFKASPVWAKASDVEQQPFKTEYFTKTELMKYPITAQDYFNLG